MATRTTPAETTAATEATAVTTADPGTDPGPGPNPDPVTTGRTARGSSAGAGRGRTTRAALAALGIGLFLGAWALVAVSDVFADVVFPSPLQVLQAGVGLVTDGTLATDAAASLARVAGGFVIGSLVGVSVAVLTARSGLASAVLQPILRLFAPVPTIALVPLAILWFGLGEESKLFLVGIGVFVPVWINAHNGLASTPRDYLRVCRCVGAGRLQVLRRVVLPEALPDIVSGLRVGVAMGFVLIVASELSGTTEGLGFRLQQAQLFSQADRLVFYLIVLGVLGALSDQVVARAARPFTAWAEAEQ